MDQTVFHVYPTPDFSLSATAAAAAKSLQSCLTLCDFTDGSLPGSSVPGILQARILEWIAISFSNACMHAKSLQSCPTLCDPMDSSPPGSSVHGILQARILEWVAISFSSQPLRAMIQQLCAMQTYKDSKKLINYIFYILFLFPHSSFSFLPSLTLLFSLFLSLPIKPLFFLPFPHNMNFKNLTKIKDVNRAAVCQMKMNSD